MKRGDIWLLIIVAFVVVFLTGQWLKSEIDAEAYTGKKYARITVDGELFQMVDLNGKEIEQVEIRTEFGYNLLEVHNGGIHMVEADCPDDLCLLMGHKDTVGETIVCLPNRVLVEIVGDSGDGEVIDAYAV